MAGGLFGRPFELNVKCIIFSIIIMSIFLYSPDIKNNFILGLVLFILFVISYVAMAWYDYFYDCQTLPLKRGEKSFTGKFKPPPHSDKQISKTHADDKHGHMMIYLSHIVLIVPLLVYIGYYKKRVNPLTYPILMVLAVFTLLYHGGAVLYGSHNL
jgi:hypothetical protein